MPNAARSDTFFRNYDAEIYAFGKRLGEEFSTSTLKRAFITRSVLYTLWITILINHILRTF